MGNLSLKKKIKYKKIGNFFSNMPYILISNDLTLSLRFEIGALVKGHFFENDVMFAVVKSKMLIRFLSITNVDKIKFLHLKGPVVLLGVRNVEMFRELFMMICMKKNIQKHLLFCIMNNEVIYHAHFNVLFNLFLKKINFFKYFLFFNIFLKREFLKLCLTMSYRLGKKIN